MTIKGFYRTLPAELWHGANLRAYERCLLRDVCWLILIDADWCWLILIGADWCWLMLINSDWCWLILMDADWFWLVLIGADWCSFMEMPESDTSQSVPTSLGHPCFKLHSSESFPYTDSSGNILPTSQKSTPLVMIRRRASSFSRIIIHQLESEMTARSILECLPAPLPSS